MERNKLIILFLKRNQMKTKTEKIEKIKSSKKWCDSISVIVIYGSVHGVQIASFMFHAKCLPQIYLFVTKL